MYEIHSKVRKSQIPFLVPFEFPPLNVFTASMFSFSQYTNRKSSQIWRAEPLTFNFTGAKVQEWPLAALMGPGGEQQMSAGATHLTPAISHRHVKPLRVWQTMAPLWERGPSFLDSPLSFRPSANLDCISGPLAADRVQYSRAFEQLVFSPTRHTVSMLQEWIRDSRRLFRHTLKPPWQKRTQSGLWRQAGFFLLLLLSCAKTSSGI